MRELVVLLVGALTLEVYSQDLQCQLTGGTTCPTMICPNTTVKYICNAPSYVSTTVWSVGTCGTNVLFLAQAPPLPGTSCVNASSSATCGPYTVTNTPVLTNNIYCLNSTLNVTVTSAMSGLVVTCSSYLPSTLTTTLIGNAMISVVTSPGAPTITSLTSSYSDQLTVTWTPVLTATSYSVSINGSTPISLPANANTYIFNGLMKSTTYNVTVVAINCAGISSISAVNQTGMGPTAPPTTSSTVPASTPRPESASSSVKLGVGIGVGVGVPLLLALILLIIGVVYCSSKGGDSRSKVSSEKGSPDNITDGSVPPSKPPRATKQASPSEEPLKPKAAPKPSEGLVYADVGIKTKQNGNSSAKPGSTKKTIEEGVAYSDIKHH